MLEINTYKNWLENKLKSGEVITASFTTKKGEARRMTCKIAPSQPKGYKNGLYSVIETTEQGERYRAFNMGTLINE